MFLELFSTAVKFRALTLDRIRAPQFMFKKIQKKMLSEQTMPS